jgi:hypothetical protein
VRRPRMIRLAVVVAALCAVASVVVAEEPLVTDRPDFTESSSVVGRGLVQLEGGTTFVETSDDNEAASVGELLLRWGLADRLELRFLLPSYVREEGPAGESSGLTDTSVGLKLQLTRGAGAGVLGGMEASLIASTTAPTGSRSMTSDSWQPFAVLAASWELSPRLGLGANLGVGRPADDSERYTTTWLSTALGIGLTDPLSVFIELYGFNREEARGPSAFTLQTGAVYLLSSDLQLDLRVARRLSEEGPDLLVGAGISLRLGG